MPQFIEDPPLRPEASFAVGHAWRSRVARVGVHVATSIRQRICTALGPTASLANGRTIVGLIDGPLSPDDPPLLAEIMANLAHGR